MTGANPASQPQASHHEDLQTIQLLREVRQPGQQQAGHLDGQEVRPLSRGITRSRTLLALGLGASAVVLGLTPERAVAGPCPDPGACVIVTLAGESHGTTVVSAAEIDAWADQPSSDYRVRSVQGGPTDVEGVGRALTLRSLVQHLADRPGVFEDLDPARLRIAKIPRPRTGDVLTLTEQNLRPAGSNGFTDGKEPVLYTPGSTDVVQYLRPLTDAPDDVNGPVLQSDVDSSLDITLSTTGQVLEPEITAVPAEPDAGQQVTFSVDVPHAPAGTTYRWLFGGGNTSTEARPRRAAPGKPGGWAVKVVVEAPDESYGQAVVALTVGNPPPTSSPTVPVNPGGGGGNGDGAGGGSGDGGGDGSSDGPAEPHPSGTTTPGAGTSTASPSTGPTPTGLPDGTVRGVLLSAADGAAPAPSATSSPTVVPPEHRFRLPGWVWPAVGALALLVGGGLGESWDLVRDRAPSRGRARRTRKAAR